MADKKVKDVRFSIVLKKAYRSVTDNKKTLLKFTSLYLVFYLVFVRALSQVDILELQEIVRLAFGEGVSELGNNLILTGTIFGLSLELNEVSSIYASILFLLFSLAFIWILRYYYSGKTTTLKRAFYEGMYPLVPVLLIFVLMLVELIPLAVSSTIVGISYANNLPTTFLEHAVFTLILILGFIISGYLLVRSIMALYIVSVPNMQPLEALKTAKKLLKGRRFTALRHILGFLILSLIIAFAFLLFMVVIKAEAAILGVVALSILALPWFHSFLFAYYRELLNE